MLTILFFCFNVLVISNLYGLSVIPITLFEFFLFKIMYYYLRKSYRIPSIYVALLNIIFTCYFFGCALTIIINLEIMIARYFKYLLIKLREREREIKQYLYGSPYRYHYGKLSNSQHIYQIILEIMCDLEGV